MDVASSIIRKFHRTERERPTLLMTDLKARAITRDIWYGLPGVCLTVTILIEITGLGGGVRSTECRSNVCNCVVCGSRKSRSLKDE